MKHKVTIIVTGVLLFACLCFGLAACGKHTHMFLEYVYNENATCTEDGTETAICECGETDTRVKEGTALGHEFGEYTSDGNVTCTEDGTETAKCIRCNVTDSRTVSALGHSITKHDGTATCTEFGTVPYYECARCEKKFKDRKATMEETDLTPRVLGHEFTVENVCIRFNDCGEQWDYTDGLEFKLNDEGGYTAIGPGSAAGNNTIIGIKIPYGYKGKYVTTIGDGAFFGLNQFKSITFPDSVTYIGRAAFKECLNMEFDLQLPKYLTYIGDGAFESCLYMRGDVVFPESCTYIGASAFDSTKITSITLPSGITKIGDSTFEGCNSLAGEVVIPDSVTEIGSRAFYSDKNISSMIFGKNLKRIGANAFWLVTMTSVVIPDGVTEIGTRAFQGCDKLADVVIPDSVTSIGSDIFSGTKYYEDPKNWVDGIAFYIGQNLAEVKTSATGEFVVREGTKSIAPSAFWGCINITSVSVPEGVMTIGGSAFASCRMLERINIPSSVVSIGASAFNGCQTLTSVEFADPNGWFVSKTNVTLDSTELMGLEDPPLGAQYLLNTYVGYNWKHIM